MKKFILIIFFLQGCAYYNTLYNAKKYYNEGIQRKKTGSPYLDLFKRSAEKCEKVLNWFPNSKWADDALYLLALNYFEMGEYTKAKIKFTEFKNRFTDSPFIAYAYLYLAKINIINDEIEEAEKNLILAKRYNIWDVSKEATKEELKIFLKKGENYKVIESGEFVLKKFPEKKQEILKIISDAYLSIRDTTKALYYLKEMFKVSEAESIGLKIAILYISLDSLKKAIDITRNYNSPDAKIIKAECFYKLGFKDSAVMEIENIFQTRRDKYGLSAALLLSEIYESNNDSVKSYEVMKKASSFNVPDSLLIFVKRKANYLSLFYEKKDSLTINNDTLISRLFLLAEGYFLYKNDYIKAYDLYKKISEEYNDTIFVPKSMFALGIIYLEKKNDTASAINTFTKIKSKFPGTIYSNSAEEIIGKIENKTDQKR